MVNYKSFYVASVFFPFKCFKNIKYGQNALIRLHFFPEFIIVKKILFCTKLHSVILKMKKKWPSLRVHKSKVLYAAAFLYSPSMLNGLLENYSASGQVHSSMDQQESENRKTVQQIIVSMKSCNLQQIIVYYTFRIFLRTIVQNWTIATYSKN